MGICKCKKRTDLFCFVHKKAVCENCIVTDHQTCVVRTYVDWLTDSDYDPPSCGICKGELREGNVLRLMCFHMFHPECLDVHASTLPPHTAKAGYSCPTCTKPIFPPEGISNPLTDLLNEHLSRASWAAPILGKIPDAPSSGNSTPREDGSANSHSSNGDSQPFTPSNGLNTVTPVIKRTAPPIPNLEPASPANDSTFGSYSRKPQNKEYSTLIMDEEDEDKYKKRSVMQLFTALGLVNPSSKSKHGRTRIRMDKRRILVILALIACLITVLFMGSQLTADIEIKEGTEPPS